MAAAPTPLASVAVMARMTPELQHYYANRNQTISNIAYISVCNLGWSIGPALFMPLMTLVLYDMGMTEGLQGLLGMINSWLLAYLVMYFSWSSDHTVSRIGRRKIYLMLSAPFVIIPGFIFPWLAEYGLFTCVVIFCIKMLFSDLKASTFPLLNIDCMPRNFIARSGALLGLISGVVGFIVNRWGIQGLSEWHAWAPYVIGSAIMSVTTVLALCIREPPIHNPTREPFRPWSALAVGLKQPRNIILFFGCASVHSFSIIWSTWSFLYATRSLGLDWKLVLAATSWSFLVSFAISYPMGWLIDRFGGLRIVIVFWMLQVAAFVLAMHSTTVPNLAWMAILMTFVGPLYGAADIMVYRAAKAEDIGSVTSSNSFFRNLYAGALIGVSGWLISSNGANYHPAFILGISMSTVGVSLYIIHRLVMRRYARTTGQSIIIAD